jgi:hypothetical protein
VAITDRNRDEHIVPLSEINAHNAVEILLRERVIEARVVRRWFLAPLHHTRLVCAREVSQLLR